MKNDLSCQVVRDILPLYIDGLTGDETNAAVENHLEGCSECREILADMKSGEEEPSAAGGANTKEYDDKTIDFLKKSRRNFRNAIIGAVIAALVISCGFFGYRYYGTSKTVPYSMINFDSIAVDGGKVSYSGSLADVNTGITGYNYTESYGVLTIEIESSAKLPSRDNTFDCTFESSEPIKEIWYDSHILWDNGDPISEGVSNIFASKHAYIGDMPANDKTANALGITRILGSFTNQLYTSSEPYGWDINLTNEFTSDDAVAREYYMCYFGTMLIGCVDNLSYVNFNYTEDGGTKFVYIDEEVASRFTGGMSVKQVCKSAKGMQDLIRKFWKDSNAMSDIIAVTDGLGPVIPH